MSSSDLNLGELNVFKLNSIMIFIYLICEKRKISDLIKHIKLDLDKHMMAYINLKTTHDYIFIFFLKKPNDFDNHNNTLICQSILEFLLHLLTQ